MNEKDSTWHERGELPPVGWHGECTWGMRANFFECVILPYGKLARASYGGDWAISPIGEHREIEFRPICTERKKAIEAAAKIAEEHNKSGAKEFYGALYDAGLLRLPEGK